MCFRVLSFFKTKNQNPIQLSFELNTNGTLSDFPNKSLMGYMTGLASPGHSMLNLLALCTVGSSVFVSNELTSSKNLECLTYPIIV